jgi:hypothetical protein
MLGGFGDAQILLMEGNPRETVGWPVRRR